MENTLKNNKTIAIFMGGKFDKDTSFKISENFIWLPYHNLCRYDTIDYGKGKILKYHKSWDWLMPVYRKIKDILNSYSKDDKHTRTNFDLLEVDINMAI